MSNELLKQFAKGKKETLSHGGNAVIYYRVSSKEQVDGQSLEVQRETCEQWAEKYGYNIMEVFGGSYESAKSDKERKEFRRMIQFARKNKGRLNTIIVYNTSRFSRTGSTTILEDLKDLNVFVFSATESYDPRPNEGRLAQYERILYALYDNETKGEIIKQNTKKALLNGRWVCHPPRGYDMKTTGKIQTITINEIGLLIRKAFLMKAN